MYLKKNVYINFAKYWTKIPVNFVFSFKKIVENITILLRMCCNQIAICCPGIITVFHPSIHSYVAREEFKIKTNIYYCMTGRVIQGNIPFEINRIGPIAGRDDTEVENGKFPQIA